MRRRARLTAGGCFVGAILAALALFPTALQSKDMLGWPEVIALLAKAKTQATTCVQVLKANGDRGAIAQAQLSYGLAEGEMDGVIAGLKTALVEGGDPGSLPNVRDSLGSAGRGLKAICDAATMTVTPHAKGVFDEIVKAAVDPLIKAISDGVSALWTHHAETDALERETKKTELEAAKWPRFKDIDAS